MSSGEGLKGFRVYVEGHGDVLSRLITPINNHMVVSIFFSINPIRLGFGDPFENQEDAHCKHALQLLLAFCRRVVHLGEGPTL